MSQVLEKPILLDETGQDIASKINGIGGKLDSQTTGIGNKLDTNSAAIVSKLNDIKEAIGTSAEFNPVMIKVVAPPTKTTYITGDNLDLTGITVNLVGSNGVQIDVTSACTFSPANGAALTSGTSSVAISYYYAKDAYTFTTSQPIIVDTASSLMPHATAMTKRYYKVGEPLDYTGLVIEAIYDYAAQAKDVTSSCTFSPAEGTPATEDSGMCEITATYTEGGNTLTCHFYVYVTHLQRITVTTPPTKTSYTVGEALDLTGIVVTAKYANSDIIPDTDVTSLCNFNPADGATLTTSNIDVAVTYTESGDTKITHTPITVTNPVYGVEWDGTSTTSWTRTDGAAELPDPTPQMSNGSGGWTIGGSPFDTIQPWAGMQVVEDADAGSLVSIPKFWYKISQNPTSHNLKIQISSTELTGFSVSPAHMDRGDGEGERDVVYVGRYHCATSTYKSTTGVQPANNETRSAFRTAIHTLGTTIWQNDFAMRFTIWLLYLVEFADWNSQEKIGYGCGGSTPATGNMGYTDSMPYHTGTTQSSRSTYGFGTQYRHIEGLWDNVLDWIDGSYPDSNGMYIILNPSNFSDFSGGTLVGLPTSGFPSQFTLETVSGIYPLFIPTISSGSSSTYSCDLWGFNASKPCICAGGDTSNDANRGLFCFFANETNYSNGFRGSRLMKLPNS